MHGLLLLTNLNLQAVKPFIAPRVAAALRLQLAIVPQFDSTARERCWSRLCWVCAGTSGHLQTGAGVHCQGHVIIAQPVFWFKSQTRQTCTETAYSISIGWFCGLTSLAPNHEQGNWQPCKTKKEREALVKFVN